jgi:selenocysteine lyase/cysteine desulfurase
MPHATVQDVVAELHAARIACRCGHMYAYRLLDKLGVNTQVRSLRVRESARACVPVAYSSAAGRRGASLGAALQHC